jgi:hypothetical protein
LGTVKILDDVFASTNSLYFIFNGIII